MKSTTPTWLLRSLVAAALCGSLGACAPLLVGGAVMGGTLVVTDRRTSGAQLEDEGIELRGVSRLQDALGDRGHVNITSYNRQVLLTGEVANAQDKQTVEQVVARVENVRGIVNELAVIGTSSLTQRSSDVLITARIKAALVDTKDLSANTFKVVTERGTVYLMGRVTQTEGTRAADVVRSIPGVQKVVRIFEYISDEELRQFLPRPPAPAASAVKSS
jgi:osmotically-inducible protein OsmY